MADRGQVQLGSSPNELKNAGFLFKPVQRGPQVFCFDPANPTPRSVLNLSAFTDRSSGFDHDYSVQTDGLTIRYLRLQPRGSGGSAGAGPSNGPFYQSRNTASTGTAHARGNAIGLVSTPASGRAGLTTNVRRGDVGEPGEDNAPSSRGNSEPFGPAQQVSAIPTPTAAIAGLVLLGITAARRRRAIPGLDTPTRAA